MIQATASGIALRLRVQPRASRTEITGALGDELKIRVAAPPVDGEANEELVRFLAKQLGVPRSAVTIASGSGSRSRLLRSKESAQGRPLLGWDYDALAQPGTAVSFPGVDKTVVVAICAACGHVK